MFWGELYPHFFTFFHTTELSKEFIFGSLDVRTDISDGIEYDDSVIARTKGTAPQKPLRLCAFVTDRAEWAWFIVGAFSLAVRLIPFFFPTVYIRHEIRLGSSEPWGHTTSHTHKEATHFQLDQDHFSAQVIGVGLNKSVPLQAHRVPGN